MCGLIGIFDYDRASLQEQENALRSVMDFLTPRGPDAQGLYKDDYALLGHRRLAVIDPQGAKQPWIDRENGAVLIYNGEIYNFRQLRSKLQTLGYCFSSHSDTEVLMKSWLEWGPDCVKQLRGMFAFAVYEPQKKELFLARDHLGIKPLFFHPFQDRGLAFASSVSALLYLPYIDRKLDLDAASHYLTTTRTTLGDKTLIRGIYTLEPGQRMLLKLGGRQQKDFYWLPPKISAKEKKEQDFQQEAQDLREIFTSTVQEQLISDAPLGGFLSGGLDSTIISSLAVELTGNNFNAYNVGYDLPGFNEWDYVREVADLYAMSCRIIPLAKEQYLDDWTWLIDWKGLPLSTPNEVPIYRLAKYLRQEYTVALTGEGADEVFGGYHIPYFAAFDFERARKTPLAADQKPTHFDQEIARLYGQPYISSRLEHFFMINSWIPADFKQCLLTEDMLQTLAADQEMFSWYAKFFEQLTSCSTFDAYMHIHARVNLEGLLYRVDSSTMAASVEARVPFTDHRLVQKMFQSPESLRIDWQGEQEAQQGAAMNIQQIINNELIQTKRVLRAAFKDKIPDNILNRPKMSFPVPFMSWFKDKPWQELSNEAIRSSSLYNTLIKGQIADSLLANPEDANIAFALWPVVNLCLWANQFDISL